MTEYDFAPSWWLPSSHPPVDDAYTAWFNAQSRCSLALRAWNTAGPRARAAAYRTYIAELAHEEAAARRLEALHPPAAAA